MTGRQGNDVIQQQKTAHALHLAHNNHPFSFLREILALLSIPLKASLTAGHLMPSAITVFQSVSADTLTKWRVLIPAGSVLRTTNDSRLWQTLFNQGLPILLLSELIPHSLWIQSSYTVKRSHRYTQRNVHAHTPPPSRAGCVRHGLFGVFFSIPSSDR